MGNKVILAVLLAGVWLGSGIAAAATPAGYWPFDGNLNDVVGTANGTFNGGQATYQKGQIGQAISLDGVAQFVNVPSPVNPSVYTITAWVKPARTTDAAIITRTDTQGPTNTWSHQLRIQGSAFHHYLWVGAARDVQGTTTIVPGSWYHVAIVAQNNGPMRLYVNGKEEGASISTAGTLWAAGTRITVGSNSGGNFGWFQGLVDDLRVFNEILAPADILVLMKTIPSAGLVSPADGVTDVPRDATLNWTPGPYPATHDVYFGTVFADVNSATRTGASGLLASQGQAGTTFDPPGSLAYGQTYYWRIDEVNTTADATIYKGSTWSFTAEPYGYPVKPVKATASSSAAGMGPEKTIDGSGLDQADQHGTEPTTMWMSGGVKPNWIQYEFDKPYKLHELKVWNANQLIEAFLGFGARKVTIEHSTDGAAWTALNEVPEFARASGTANYTANTTVNLGGIMAQYVKLTIDATWGGLPQTGLSEVRFSYVPLQARAPLPANAATNVPVDTSLSWRPGREAGSHSVSLGTDPNALGAAQMGTEHSFDPGLLDLGTTYYWKVDEVNTVTYPGDVWRFTTQPYQVVDDFESYTDKEDTAVYATWADGYIDKSSGSTVGLMTAVNGTYCETTIFHGGKQSVPLAYDNTAAPFFSEATRTFAPPQDWTASGIKSLSLWFRGTIDNSGQLYVKINGAKVPYDGPAADLARATWQVWNIDLSQAGKVNSVRTLVLGIEGNGAKGILYFDDIRLYPKTPGYLTPVPPQATGLVASYAFDEGSGTIIRDASGNKNDGALRGTTQWTTGNTGGALRFNGIADYVEVPDSPSLQVANTITMAAWILREAHRANWERVMAKSDASAYDYWLQVTSAGAVGGGFTDSTGAARTIDTTAGAALPVNQWVHIAFVYDGTGLRGYVNGQLSKSVNVGSVKIRTTAGRPLWFGRLLNGYVFVGRIDEGCVYNRALTQEEILGLMGQKTPVAKPF
jgi:hypothetical protein